MNPVVLEPLAARYARWLALPAQSTSDTSAEDEVRASFQRFEDHPEQASAAHPPPAAQPGDVG